MQKEVLKEPTYVEELLTLFRSNLGKEELLEKIIADAMEQMTPEERKKLYPLLGEEYIAEILSYTEDAAEYLQEINLENAARVISEMDSDDAVDVLENLDADTKTRIVDLLDDDAEKDVNTWEDVLKTLPILQKNSMSFAIPSVERKINNVTNPDLANYYAQLYQRGGTLYDADAMETTIASQEGIEAFEFYTKLFTNYKLDKQNDFNNRFRSGEMPIGCADYSNFNTLAVFAPEIKGLWNFGLIPGMKKEDGSIDRSVQSWGTASMMLRGAEERGKKEIAWQFLKWWESSEVQSNYASELEAVMGAAARYATANRNTFETLSWSSDESAALKEQWKSAFGLPEVAGGYYTARHITNAIRKVMNENEDPRETLLDYVITINDELTNKREEFGLPIKDTKK